ncbi:Ig-like domain-containing protein [[Clostridium] aminophilum]|uniref:Ig-like domain-containing protein n=1 Tax=[Clostridium] aminophilum TaxID=1526 RepID=UPI003F9CF26E
MKEKKRLLVLVLALICTFSMLMPLEVQAATVKLNATKKTIEVGKTTTLKVKGTTKTVKWNSSNKKIATVSSKGKIKGIKAGTCTIKAKVGGKTYKCKVKVKKASTKPTNPSGYLTKEQAQAKIEAACRAHGLVSSQELGQQLWDSGAFDGWGLSYDEVMALALENCSWFETAIPKNATGNEDFYLDEFTGASAYRIVFARETDRNYIFTCYRY